MEKKRKWKLPQWGYVGFRVQGLGFADQGGFAAEAQRTQKQRAIVRTVIVMVIVVTRIVNKQRYT